MEKLEKFFEEIFIQKAPWQLPVKAKEVIVQIAPWVTLIIVIISLPTLLGVFGFSSMFLGWGLVMGYAKFYYISLFVLLIEVILMALAISPLIKRQINGWRLIYYTNLISFVYSLLRSGTTGDVLWAIISLAIGLYIIFQIKSYYK